MKTHEARKTYKENVETPIARKTNYKENIKKPEARKYYIQNMETPIARKNYKRECGDTYSQGKYTQ